MSFEQSPRSRVFAERLLEFMAGYVYPNEARYFAEAARLGPWKVYPVVEELKQTARRAGLWNLFMPGEEHGAGLSNLDYAPLCEIMGRSQLAPELFNCSAPDTGNMEILARYGSVEQKERWLTPLLAGEMRSAFAMTEPERASSDATEISCRIERSGDGYVINGRKWYTTGATDPRCRLIILMGKTTAGSPEKHLQQSMILVPRSAKGVRVLRAIPVLGYHGVPDRAAEVLFENVRVPTENILLGEGRGFEIAQGRLGPGRIHHCMRLVGLAERVLEKLCRRATQRSPFGRPLSEQTVTLERIAQSRILIEQTRLLTLNAASRMDTAGNKAACAEIAMIKVAAPTMACTVIDWAMQLFGGAGITDDHFLGAAWATARLLRIADGPDEVHRNQLARMELRRHVGDPTRTGGEAGVLSVDSVIERSGSGPWPAP